VLEQLQPREDLSWAAHEGLQESELLWREVDLVIPAPRSSRGRVETQVVDL